MWPTASEEFWGHVRFAAVLVAFLLTVLWTDAALRKRARKSRRRAAKNLEEGRTTPFEFEEPRFRGFEPACPEAESIFIHSFDPDNPRLKILEPSEVTDVRFPNPRRPTYGFSRTSTFRSRSLVPGAELKLALKALGRNTLIVRRGYVVDKGEARDISGMIGAYRPGKSYITVYRHYSSREVPLEELFERIDRIEARQHKQAVDVARAGPTPIARTDEPRPTRTYGL